jgi:hypothetical protein
MGDHPEEPAQDQKGRRARGQTFPGPLGLAEDPPQPAPDARGERTAGPSSQTPALFGVRESEPKKRDASQHPRPVYIVVVAGGGFEPPTFGL